MDAQLGLPKGVGTGAETLTYFPPYENSRQEQGGARRALVAIDERFVSTGEMNDPQIEELDGTLGREMMFKGRDHLPEVKAERERSQQPKKPK